MCVCVCVVVFMLHAYYLFFMIPVNKSKIKSNIKKRIECKPKVAYGHTQECAGIVAYDNSWPQKQSLTRSLGLVTLTGAARFAVL